MRSPDQVRSMQDYFQLDHGECVVERRIEPGNTAPEAGRRWCCDVLANEALVAEIVQVRQHRRRAAMSVASAHRRCKQRCKQSQQELQYFN